MSNTFMRGFVMKTYSLLAWVFLASCSANSFSGTNGYTPSRQPANVDNSTPNSGIKEDDQSVTCIDKVLPIRMVFVLDITSSMSADLNVVANNVMSFSENLENIKFSGAKANERVPVQIGMIQFADRVVYTDDLTDPRSLSSKARRLSVLDEINVDYPEAGLLALRAATKMLEKAETEQGEGLPIIVMVTDALAHDGSGDAGYRNCQIGSFSEIGENQKLKRLALYDSSPNESLDSDDYGRRIRVSPEDAQCAPYRGFALRGPSIQWQQFRSIVLKNRIGSGKGLGFPFSASSLLNAIPSDLQNTYKICK